MSSIRSLGPNVFKFNGEKKSSSKKEPSPNSQKTLGSFIKNLDINKIKQQPDEVQDIIFAMDSNTETKELTLGKYETIVSKKTEDQKVMSQVIKFITDPSNQERPSTDTGPLDTGPGATNANHVFHSIQQISGPDDGAITDTESLSGSSVGSLTSEWCPNPDIKSDLFMDLNTFQGPAKKKFLDLLGRSFEKIGEAERTQLTNETILQATFPSNMSIEGEPLTSATAMKKIDDLFLNAAQNITPPNGTVTPRIDNLLKDLNNIKMTVKKMVKRSNNPSHAYIEPKKNKNIVPARIANAILEKIWTE